MERCAPAGWMDGRFITALALAAGTFTASTAVLAAQAYPAKPVRIIAPYGVGGSYDVIARMLAQKLGEQMGQSFLVDTRPGAAGRIGMDVAAKAPPDGHTMVVIGNTQTIVPGVHKIVPYDLATSFEYVAMVATIMNTFVVSPLLPVNNLSELVAYSKAKPGTVRYGSGGTGSITHLAGEMLRTATGGDFSHVPYKAGALAIPAMMTNDIQFGMLNLLNAQPHIQSGKLRVIAVSGLRRSTLLPNVPTLDESGAKGLEIVEFHALAMPRGAPASVVTRMNAEINKALASPDLRQQFAQQAAEPAPGTPADARRYVLNEQAKFAKVLKQIGLDPTD